MENKENQKEIAKIECIVEAVHILETQIKRLKRIIEELWKDHKKRYNY